VVKSILMKLLDVCSQKSTWLSIATFLSAWWVMPPDVVNAIPVLIAAIGGGFIGYGNESKDDELSFLGSICSIFSQKTTWVGVAALASGFFTIPAVLIESAPTLLALVGGTLLSLDNGKKS